MTSITFKTISRRFTLDSTKLTDDDSENKRRRRTKSKKSTAKDTIRSFSENQASETIDLFSRDVDDIAIEVVNTQVKSRLPPIAGTIEEKQAKYNEKGVIERVLEEYAAPTAPGTEPKTVKLMKNITWVSVLVLVLIEIVVSVKVGGSPFGATPVDTSIPASPPPPTFKQLMDKVDSRQ